MVRSSSTSAFSSDKGRELLTDEAHEAGMVVPRHLEQRRAHAEQAAGGAGADVIIMPMIRGDEGGEKVRSVRRPSSPATERSSSKSGQRIPNPRPIGCPAKL
jgi:hypothetical protein